MVREASVDIDIGLVSKASNSFSGLFLFNSFGIGSFVGHGLIGHLVGTILGDRLRRSNNVWTGPYNPFIRAKIWPYKIYPSLFANITIRSPSSTDYSPSYPVSTDLINAGPVISRNRYGCFHRNNIRSRRSTLYCYRGLPCDPDKHFPCCVDNYRWAACLDGLWTIFKCNQICQNDVSKTGNYRNECVWHVSWLKKLKAYCIVECQEVFETNWSSNFYQLGGPICGS